MYQDQITDPAQSEHEWHGRNQREQQFAEIYLAALRLPLSERSRLCSLLEAKQQDDDLVSKEKSPTHLEGDECPF